MTLGALIKKKIDDLIEHQTEALIGGVPDFAAYQRIVGHIAGLASALREIEPLVRDDEED